MPKPKRKKPSKKKTSKTGADGLKRVAINRKARHLYEFIEHYEAGISLQGNEVKGIRESGADLKDSFVRIEDGQAVAIGIHIAKYSNDGAADYNPLRERRLLLHKREIKKIVGRINEKGYTAIPVEMYFKGSYLKMKLGVARGKRSFDKKQALKERDIARQMQREIKDQR